LPLVVGVLALQGDFEAHAKLLRSLGAEPREVRVPAELGGLDGLIVPGGESTVMELGIEREGLAEPLRAVFIRARWIEESGRDVEVLAEVYGHAVAAREDRLLVVAFHPELTDDPRLHELFLAGLS